MTSKKRERYGGQIAGNYDLEETIGRGHFAVVKLAKHCFTREKVAVKIIDKTKLDEISKAHLFQEVRCMKLVQHPHVVRLYEVIDTQTKLYLILELGDGGDMYDYIMKHDKGLDESKARVYFRQIVQAIHYCHKLHVVHRDLKPENVVFFEKLGIVKLTDFGFSNKFIPGSKLETSCGSLAYSAPEILLGDSYDAPAVDVWSMGVILFMLVCGEPPFQEANDSETLTMIMDCKYRLPPHLSSECKELIGRMLVREPSGRASLDDIMNHMWVTDGQVAPLPMMPLMLREDLKDEDRVDIIQKMVEGKIGKQDEILGSLEIDAYDHITATYYLLAERRLRRLRENESIHEANRQTSPRKKPQLAPLALSPRSSEKQKIVDGVEFACTCDDPSDYCACHHSADAARMRKKSVDSLVSPSSSRVLLPPSNTISRPVLRPSCSLIVEEAIDEDEEDNEDSPTKNKKTQEGYASDDSDSRSTTADSPSRSAPPARRRRDNIRPLHSVRSSPQLLNQIFEEGESEDDDLLSQTRCPLRVQRNSIASPDMVRKYNQSRKKRLTSGSRGTSCSSSDASDTDDTEGRKRKEKLKARLQRRDSSDHSSDTDGPGSGSGGPGPGRGPLGGGGNDHGGGGNDDEDNNRKDNDDNNRRHRSSKGRHSGGGKQNGTIPATQYAMNNPDQVSPAELARKISNLSLASTLSISSMSSRSKYVVDAAGSATPPKGVTTTTDVNMLNEENRQRGARIIHVRSKDFTDLVQRFSNARDSNKETSVKFRRRSKDKLNRVDINRNGLITHGDEEVMEMDIKRNDVNVVKTKCCSLV